MSFSSRESGDHVPLFRCPICSTLSETETTFRKYGWEEKDRDFPGAVAELVPVESIDSYEKRNHHVKRCPICGIFYLYEFSYEYLVNGSEDEEILTRLPLPFARRFLSEDEYLSESEALRNDFKSEDKATRRYAVQSTGLHYLMNDDRKSLESLLVDPDPVVVEAVLDLFRDRIKNCQYRELIRELRNLPDGFFPAPGSGG